MDILSIGYHHEHDSHFCIDRPYGLGDNWLFLVLHTPAVFTVDGEELESLPNSYILYSESMPEHYRAAGEHYIDDWFHFSVKPEDEQFLEKLGIILNRPVPLGDASELSALIRSMTHEFYTGRMHSREIVTLQMRMLFFKLSRLIRDGAQMRDLVPGCEDLIRLREEIYRDVSKIDTVSGMASRLSMSQSAFQHTYKRLFGTNVTADITRSRIQHAQALLTSTDLPLREIALHSGYTSEFHLMRHFKNHTGMTPTEYRQKRR